MAERRPPGPAPTTMARFLVDGGLLVALEEDGSAAAVSPAAARLKGFRDTIIVLQLFENIELIEQ